MPEDRDRMNSNCEFALLLNSEKFVKENNLKLKDKASKEVTILKIRKPFLPKIDAPK